MKKQKVLLWTQTVLPNAIHAEEAVKAGVTAIIQPGGSIKDQLSIDVCNEHGIAMVYTGSKTF